LLHFRAGKTAGVSTTPSGIYVPAPMAALEEAEAGERQANAH
jgi:hypothetical protein